MSISDNDFYEQKPVDVPCAQCKKDKKKTRVYILGQMVVAVGVNPFYDEKGMYHHHDGSKIEVEYICSFGHKWRENQSRHCWCGWSPLD